MNIYIRIYVKLTTTQFGWLILSHARKCLFFSFDVLRERKNQLCKLLRCGASYSARAISCVIADAGAEPLSKPKTFS